MKFIGLFGLIMLVSPNAFGARFPFGDIVADNLFERELNPIRSIPVSSEARLEPTNATPESIVVTNSPRQKHDICTRVYKIEEAIRLCMGYVKWNDPVGIRASFLMNFLQNMCSEQESIRRCLHDRLDRANCPHNPEMKALYERTFDYCEGEYIPLAVQIFLEANYNASLSDLCTDIIFELQCISCDQTNKPNGQWRTIPERIDYMNRKFQWYVDCMSESDLTEFVPACNMRRKQAYRLLFASVPMYKPFGIRAFDLFERFIRINTD